jgi:hypothetical protein
MGESSSILTSASSIDSIDARACWPVFTQSTLASVFCFCFCSPFPIFENTSPFQTAAGPRVVAHVSPPRCVRGEQPPGWAPLQFEFS